jgi:hemin uptake protein HemP
MIVPHMDDRKKAKSAITNNGTARSPISRSRSPIKSEVLFGGGRLLKIIHNQELYTLRITSNNKLILTK